MMYRKKEEVTVGQVATRSILMIDKLGVNYRVVQGYLTCIAATMRNDAANACS